MILLRHRIFGPESLNVASFMTDLKAKRRIWIFCREQLWFQDIWNNRNNLATRQQFRADFRMSPGIFSDVTLVRYRLEEEDTSFREAGPIKKRIGTALWRLATGNSY